MTMAPDDARRDALLYQAMREFGGATRNRPRSRVPSGRPSPRTAALHSRRYRDIGYQSAERRRSTARASFTESS